MSVRLNNGTGTFSGESEVAVGTLPAAVTTADVDGDGDLLAATNDVPAVVSVRLNNGSGTFSGGTDVPASFLLDAIATADIDNDEDLDVLAPVQGVGTGNVSSVVVLLNNGSGGFTREQMPVLARPPGAWPWVTLITTGTWTCSLLITQWAQSVSASTTALRCSGAALN